MIKKAESSDLSAILAIYDNVLANEEAGLTSNGWVRGIYPTVQNALEALEAGDMFVMSDGENIVAALRINQVQMPAYSQVKWTVEAAPEKVMSFHTLAVSPEKTAEAMAHVL